MLEFDMKPRAANDLVANARRNFRLTMRARVQRRRERARICRRIGEVVSAMSRVSTPFVRVALLEASRREGALAPTYLRTAWLHLSDPTRYWQFTDDRLRYPVAGSHPGAAWLLNMPLLRRLKQSGSTDPDPLDPVIRPIKDGPNDQRYRQQLLWADAAWCLVVPASEQPNERARWIVLVDSDEPVDNFFFGFGEQSPEFERLVADVKDRLAELYVSEAEYERAIDEIRHRQGSDATV